jgi:hypothetical protein
MAFRCEPWYLAGLRNGLREVAARIVVTDTALRGYFQTSDYTFWEQRDELPVQLLPVTEIEVKAEIARPALHEIVPTDAIYRVYGAPWTGESESKQSGSKHRRGKQLGASATAG